MHEFNEIVERMLDLWRDSRLPTDAEFEDLICQSLRETGPEGNSERLDLGFMNEVRPRFVEGLRERVAVLTYTYLDRLLDPLRPGLETLELVKIDTLTEAGCAGPDQPRYVQGICLKFQQEGWRIRIPCEDIELHRPHLIQLIRREYLQRNPPQSGPLPIPYKKELKVEGFWIPRDLKYVWAYMTSHQSGPGNPPMGVSWRKWEKSLPEKFRKMLKIWFAPDEKETESFYLAVSEVEKYASRVIAIASLNATTKKIASEKEKNRLEDAGRLERIRELIIETGYPGVGLSRWFEQHLKEIKRAAEWGLHVLVTGPTGTGKEGVAGTLHKLYVTQGRKGKLIPANCAVGQENLLESKLFGHEKGAFTGAAERHKGDFERADGGTLFLDEIGEASLDLQAKLLRVLEDGSFVRVGGETEIKVDVRIVAATNRDLAKMELEGTFRSDLRARLRDRVIEIKSLDSDERLEDKLIIALDVLRNLNAKRKRKVKLSAIGAMLLLSNQTSDNVRGLRRALIKAIDIAEDAEEEELGPGCFPDEESHNRRIEDLELRFPDLSFVEGENDGERLLALEGFLDQLENGPVGKIRKIAEGRGSMADAAQATGIPKSTIRDIADANDIKFNARPGRKSQDD